MNADWVAGTLWFLVTLITLRSATELAAMIEPEGRPAARLAHTLVIFWALVVASSTILGLCSLLTGPWLLATAPGLAWATRWLVRRVVVGRSKKSPERDVFFRFDCDGGQSWHAGFWRAAWMVVASLIVARAAIQGLMMFPTDYDTLMYHLPMVDQWLHARGLVALNASHWSTPGNGELLTLWAVAPFSGDFLISLTNAVPAVLLAAATYDLAEQLEITLPYRHLLALSIMINGVISDQILDSKNDLAVASLFFACLSNGIGYATKGQVGRLVLGSISFGLLAGVKFYALGYAAVALMAVCLVTARAGGLQRAARVASAWVVGGAAFGGYWYLRNFLLTGSPLFPKGIGLGPDPLASLYPDLGSSSILGNARPEIPALLLDALLMVMGPHYLIAALSLPISLFWLIDPRAYPGERGTIGLDIRRAIAGLAIASGLVWSITPVCVENVPGSLNQLGLGFTPMRYGFCFLNIALLSMVLMLDDLTGTRLSPASQIASRSPFSLPRFFQTLIPVAGAVALVGLCIWQTMVKDRVISTICPDEMLVFNESKRLLVAGGVSAAIYLIRRPSAPRFTLAIVATLVFSMAIAGLSRGWHDNFAAYYGRMMNMPTIRKVSHPDQPAQRICVLDYRPYPYFGSRRQNLVFNPPFIAAADELVREIDRRKSLLVVAQVAPVPPWGPYQHVDRWLDDRPDRFEIIERSDNLAIYRVRGKRDSSGHQH